jgi:hypothetical protein
MLVNSDDRGGLGNVTTLLHGLGELAVSRDPLIDGPAAHAQLSSQVGVVTPRAQSSPACSG